ncbi:hypothetical protein CFB82_39650 [Burkholderia sp. HI2714]|uniref:hypothetical protein n=1 Tax=Burkholderia sp. HI2714 TaxID=2015359 RepID=UPI000B7A6F65|nr:hypothetical protein [Burkholderia sp. HI2714]OXJ22646.1 hypothetical protein CFB82_39650 [Burkholderia sp. HI2714]
MKPMFIKAAVVVAAITAGAAAHAQLGVDSANLSAAIAQVQAETRRVEAETARVDVAMQAKGLLHAKAGNANAAASSDTNQQILATLIGIDSTLKQLLELERMKASAATH